MSTDTEHVEDGATPSLLETWDRWYHLPAIGAVLVFMFWTRFQGYDRFVREDGGIWLSAIDSWYHWRTTVWTVENYPRTILVDPWTSFPDGHLPGQFGTLFDQIVATVAMVIGLGSPSTTDILLAVLITVPAMAALVALPTFYIGRRLGGTGGGLVSILLLALAPGTFLFRTTAGQHQHHVAEVLFMSLAVLAMMVAVRTAEVDRPIYELVVAREWEPLKRPAIYSALAGFATLLYILSWPPGVVLVGVFGLFFVIQLTVDFLNGRSPDHLAFVAAVSMPVVSLGTALYVQEPGFSATGFDYFQPTFPLLVAAGAVFMAWLARLWEGRDVDPRGYPAAIAGSIVVAFVGLAVVLPDVYSTLVGNLTGRMIPIGHSPGALTVAEVQPPEDYTDHVFGEFGMAFYTMLAGLALLLVRPWLGREYRGEYTLIAVWTVVLISMSMTQSRFAYYLVVAVAVLNAAFVAEVSRLFDLDFRGGIDAIRGIETYQAIVLLLVVALLFAPLLPPMAGANTAWERGDAVAQPSSDAQVWEGANDWMSEHTPEPGDWGGAGNADQLDYFGTYEFEEDERFAYPEGSYGVISWWDYGHLINVQGERMAHSNPFQSNVRSSSAFLLADTEERAELTLDAVAAGESPRYDSIEELEAMAEGADASDPHVRYVMIDYAMAGGKFPAITAWTGPDYDHYVTPADHEAGEPIEGEQLLEGDLPYDETMLSKLYFDDADGLEHYRLVHENAEPGTVTYASYAQLDENGEVVHVDELGQPTTPADPDAEPVIVANDQLSPVEIQQLEQREDVVVFDVRQAAAVKSYERVAGATLEIDDDRVEDGLTAVAAVELETDDGRTFNYTQQATVEDGTAELTVPYPTDDELGVEDGYTDSSVVATGEFEVVVGEPTAVGLEQEFRADVDVPERTVVDGETVPVDLEAFEDEVELPDEEEETAPEDADGDEELTDDEQAGEEESGADETGAVTHPLG